MFMGMTVSGFGLSCGPMRGAYDSFEGLPRFWPSGTGQVPVECLAPVGDLTRGPAMERIGVCFSSFSRNLSGKTYLTQPVIFPPVARFIP